MLVLEARAVALTDESYTNKNEQHVPQYHLNYATDGAMGKLILRGEALQSLGASAPMLQAFGTAFRAHVEPAFINNYGNREPALAALSIEVLADENGQVPAKAKA